MNRLLVLRLTSLLAVTLTASIAVGDQGLYSGACSTPEYDQETKTLFTLGVDGDLIAWDTAGEGRQKCLD